jgi:DeoR family transcriptional regulator, fructose operon transcriptional repressor
VNGFERKDKILEAIKETGTVSINTLAKDFDVTKVTVRSDLDELARLGLVVRTHGGGVSPENQRLTRLVANTIHENIDQKESIARAAFQYIQPGNTILIDAGSTTAFLGRLVKRMRITVITNSVLVLQELLDSESVELFIPRGALRKHDLALIGEASRFFLSQVRADLVFLGATSYSVEKDISCANLIEGETKKSMISCGLRTCLLADSSKAGKVALAHVCDWEDIDVFITDSIGAGEREQLESRGVEVVVAS